MKTNLTRREKALMFTASILLLAFLSIQYVILPMYKEYASMQELLATISTQKIMLDVNIQNEIPAREAYAAAEANFEEIKSRYPELIPNEEVDRILTSICVQNRLSPVTLNMSEAFDPNLAVPKGGKPDPDAVTAPSDFLVVNATMTLAGDYDSLKRLIDTVAQMDYIRISRVSFAYKEPDDPATKPNISVFFEVTMLNDTASAPAVTSTAQ